MTLACTKVHAYGIEIGEGLTKRFHQYLLVEGTGAGTDVSHDFDEPAGTLLAAVDGDTVGTVIGAGDALKAACADIGVRAQQLVLVGGETLVNKIQAAADAAGVYTMTVTNHLPDIAYHAAEGPTAWKYLFAWVLKDGERPVEIQVG